MCGAFLCPKGGSMLTIQNKNISISGNSTIDNQVLFSFQASINSNNPKEVQFSSWVNDHELYKSNRKECNADYESFQDAVYKEQDKLLETMTYE